MASLLSCDETQEEDGNLRQKLCDQFLLHAENLAQMMVQVQCFTTGVPNLWAADQYQFVACWELGCTAGGDCWAKE